MTIAPVTLGDYELLEELGRGAMGVVFKARQKNLGRIVALKMVLTGQPRIASLDRFKQEARSAAALDHPGIVPLFDFGEYQGQPYYTMAFIDGETLAGLLHNQGPLPPRQAAQILARLADAVDYAHQRGILHRDLKPDNILVDRQGHPRIADFGLARRIEDGPNLTSAGSLVGTPLYMSPEQARGLTELTPAVDIYSLGAVLFAMLTGRSPFSGESACEVLLKVTQEPAQPLRQINPELPEALERIVLRCLEKDPARRYSSAADLAADLRAWLDTIGQQQLLPAAVVQTRRCQDAVRPATPSENRKPTAARNSTVARPGGWRLRWLALAGVVLAVVAGVGVVGARLIPALDPESPSDSEWVKAERHDFPLKVSLLGLSPNKKGIWILPLGQPIRFVIESPHDVHLGIWSLQEDGVLQLFPNEYETDTLVRAGVTLVVPGNAKYRIVTTPASRVEFFRIVATTTKWQPLPGRQEGPFLAFNRGAEFKGWQEHQARLTGRGAVAVPRGVEVERLTGSNRPVSSRKAEALVSEVVLPYRVQPGK
jgi:tRNA A-37 threonylcarbamoyl transferase component Bud32